MPHPFRFPKSVRLTRASEFRNVREKGQSFHGRFLVLNISEPPPAQEQSSQQTARIGFITSRRVGSAVVRNRVRRRLRSCRPTVR